MTDASTEPAEPAAPAPPNNLVGLGILALWIALGAALQAGAPYPGPLTFAFVMAGWILAVMAHEFSHALVGWIAGDHTVAAKGYLAFDPRRYGDLGTSLVIPVLALVLGGIGFPGGAVYLRTDLMRGPGWRAAASLAGPAATFVVLVLLGLVVRMGAAFGGLSPLIPALAFLAFLQAMAVILNLLPVPGLDGFNAIRPFLPERWSPALRKWEGVGMLLLLAVLFLLPGASAALFAAAAILAHLTGLDLSLVPQGYRQFRFWA
jgi:Zn-dependent protease